MKKLSNWAPYVRLEVVTTVMSELYVYTQKFVQCIHIQPRSSESMIREVVVVVAVGVFDIPGVFHNSSYTLAFVYSQRVTWCSD